MDELLEGYRLFVEAYDYWKCAYEVERIFALSEIKEELPQEWSRSLVGAGSWYCYGVRDDIATCPWVEDYFLAATALAHRLYGLFIEDMLMRLRRELPYDIPTNVLRGEATPLQLWSFYDLAQDYMTRLYEPL